MHSIESIQKLMSTGGVALHNIPEALYHSFPAMSNSGMKEFEKAPGLYDFMRKNPSEDTPARVLGRMIHLAIGEPNRFKNEVVIVDGHRGGKEVKALVEAYEAAGKTVIKSEMHKEITDTANYCHKHKLIKEILKEGKSEVSLFWIDPQSKAPCKARLDWVTEKGVICDWKTFDPNFSEDLIEYQMRTNNYHYQAAWYLEGYRQVFGKNPIEFYNVFIRTSGGIRAQVTRIVDHSIEEVTPIIKSQLLRFAECLKEDHWTMGDEEVIDIVVKQYKK